jgi:uncharacterized protein (TIGR03000 family)
VTVRLPADARLLVDDDVCPLTSSVRSFTTSGLKHGQQYYYMLRMEVVRDGQILVESRRVQFAAGQRIAVDFTESGAAQSPQP